MLHVGKKIYLHNLILESEINNTTRNIRISMSILNNSNVPFDLQSFISWAENMSDLLQRDYTINASGFWYYSSNECTSVSYLLINGSDKSWRIRGGNYGSTAPVNISVQKSIFANIPFTIKDDITLIN